MLDISLPPLVKQSINAFIQPHIDDNNTIAIILAGSYAYGNPSMYSDVDIHIILEKAEMRKRGNTWINEIEIEYFINPIKQVIAYLKDEKNIIRPTTAHMLHFGKVIYKKDNSEELDELLKTAKDIIENPMKEMDEEEVELFRYILDDIRKDLLDAKLEKNLIAYHKAAISAVETALKVIFRVYQTYQEKPKALENQLSKIDPEFLEKFKVVFKSNYESKAIGELITYVEEKLGGKRPDEWSIENSLTV